MKILTIANEKGGVGKTFLSTQFAFYCALKFRLRVAVIDLDQQANASRCLATRGLAVKANIPSTDLLLGSELPGAYTDRFVYFAADDRLSALEKQGDAMHGVFVDNLLAALKQLESSFDLVIIDTNPNPDIRSNAGLLVCTHLLSPIQLTKEPIDGIERLFNRINDISTLNPNLPSGFLGMLPNQVESGNFQIENGKQLIATFGKLLLAVNEVKPMFYRDENGQILAKKEADGAVSFTKVSTYGAIKRHAGIAEAQALGCPIWEMPNQSNAWAEMKRVFFTVLEAMDVDRPNEALADQIAVLDECKRIYGATWKAMLRQFWMMDNSTILLGLSPDKIKLLRQLKGYVPLNIYQE